MMAKKRINEIFYSLQGEGRNTGRAAVFIRFAGCNLRCPFCDTDFTGYEELTDDEIIGRISKYKTTFVVLTGGEPTLQVDERFIDFLHSHGYEVAMETNGTHALPSNLDWSTVSPKASFLSGIQTACPVVTECDELKCIYDGLTQVSDLGIKAKYYYLQPCDTGDKVRNADIMSRCVYFILRHPRWRLSLQTHKLIGVR